jgi:hypothetical protein
MLLHRIFASQPLSDLKAAAVAAGVSDEDFVVNRSASKVTIVCKVLVTIGLCIRRLTSSWRSMESWENICVSG